MPKYRHSHFKKILFCLEFNTGLYFFICFRHSNCYAEEADNLSIDDAMAGEPQKYNHISRRQLKVEP